MKIPEVSKTEIKKGLQIINDIHTEIEIIKAMKSLGFKHDK